MLNEDMNNEISSRVPGNTNGGIDLASTALNSTDRYTRAAALTAALLQNESVKDLELLDRGLPAHLRYHNTEHTLVVLNHAVHLAVIAGKSPEQIELIALAAAYHDTGYTVQEQNNEPIGARFARAAMQTAGYTEAAISIVEQMILDTQLVVTANGLKQAAHHELSPFLLDADLSNLGSSDFLIRTSRLFAEFTGTEARSATKEDLRKFLDGSLEFIQDHAWLSPEAASLFDGQKMQNIIEIEQILAGTKDFEGRRL